MAVAAMAVVVTTAAAVVAVARTGDAAGVDAGGDPVVQETTARVA